jgi:hypothetical protein
VASIYPVRGRRCDILSVLFLCTVAGEPSSAEEGRWFSAAEAMGLVPLRKGRDGIVPSYLVGLSLCLRALGRPHDCHRLEPSPAGAPATTTRSRRSTVSSTPSVICQERRGPGRQATARQASRLI